ncbi:O-antigen ligase family protein [Chitinimonas naiadis]
MINRTNWRTWLAGLLLFAYPCLLPLTVKGSDQVVLLLALAGLWTLLAGRSDGALPRPDKAALGAIALVSAAGLTSLLNVHASTRQMVPYLCPLLALLLFPLARRGRLSVCVAWWSLVAGLLIAAGISLWQVFYLGMSRAQGHHYPNTYGALALLMLALVAAAWPLQHRSGAGRVGLALAGVAGMITIILSGSRSAWLATAVLGIWFFGRNSRRQQGIALLLAINVLLLTLLIPDLALRWQAALQDVQLYDQGNADTSIGLRFVMWRGAWEAFLAHPLLGLGADGFGPWLAGMAHHGDGPATLLLHNHAHNELLYALASGGLLGALALLAGLYLPWRAFRHYEQGDGRQRAAARAGQALVLGTILLGLTDTLFVHRFLLTWYAVAVVLLLGWAGRSNRPTA